MIDQPSSATGAAAPFGWARAADAGLTFRRITDGDLPFLARLYASTRTEELAATGWSDQQKAAFLESQFRAQHAHYQQYYPKADCLVTMRGGEDIGRLYIERWPSQHCIIDIAWLPAHRGKGLGTAMLRDLMDEAASCRQGRIDPCREIQSGDAALPASRFYDRRGQGRLRLDALERGCGPVHNRLGKHRLIAVAAL